MNKRIKLLAEQAGLNYHNWITNESNINDGDFKYPRLEDYEKFAELIVRECANHCDLLLDHKISSEWSRGTHDCSKAIRKHFGVEE